MRKAENGCHTSCATAVIELTKLYWFPNRFWERFCASELRPGYVWLEYLLFLLGVQKSKNSQELIYPDSGENVPRPESNPRVLGLELVRRKKSLLTIRMVLSVA
jgi:hypothetical protein